MTARTTTQYVHRACGAPIVWAKGGGACTGAACRAVGLKVPDCDPVSVPLPAAEPAARPGPDELALFSIEDVTAPRTAEAHLPDMEPEM